MPIARYIENNNSRKENTKYMHYIQFALCFYLTYCLHLLLYDCINVLFLLQMWPSYLLFSWLYLVYWISSLG